MNNLSEREKRILLKACETIGAEVDLQIEIDETWESVPGVLEIDAHLSIRKEPGKSQSYAVEIKPTLTSTNLFQAVNIATYGATKMDAHPLIIANYINPNLAEKLRTALIEYIDTAGNAYLNGPDFYINIQGQRLTEKPPLQSFNSSKAVQLIGLLLAHPLTINDTVRDLSLNAGVSLGGVSQIFNELKKRGFIRRKGKKEYEIRNHAALLEIWTQGYAETLRPKLQGRTYRLNPKFELGKLPELLERTNIENVLIGGELAASIYSDYLNPSQATLHIFSAEQPLPHHMFVPDSKGNIKTVHGFGEIQFWSGAMEKPAREQIANPLLVYAELLATDRQDRRIAKTADIIRQMYHLDIPHQQ